MPYSDILPPVPSPTMRLELTVILQRGEEGAGFTASIAELPGPFGRGKTLAEARDALRGQLLPFLLVNRDLALGEVAEGAVLERMVLSEEDPGAPSLE